MPNDRKPWSFTNERLRKRGEGTDRSTLLAFVKPCKLDFDCKRFAQRVTKQHTRCYRESMSQNCTGPIVHINEERADQVIAGRPWPGVRALTQVHGIGRGRGTRNRMQTGNRLAAEERIKF